MSKSLIIVQLILVLLTTVKVNSESELVVTANPEKLIVIEGNEAILKCTIASEALGCTFESPNGTPYNMLRGSAYEQGRLQQQELENNDCAMKITEIKNIENGQWECQVTTKDSDGNYKSGMGKIEVVIAEAPKQVYLTSDGQNKSFNSKEEMTFILDFGNTSCEVFISTYFWRDKMLNRFFYK